MCVLKYLHGGYELWPWLVQGASWPQRYLFFHAVAATWIEVKIRFGIASIQFMFIKERNATDATRGNTFHLKCPWQLLDGKVWWELNEFHNPVLQSFTGRASDFNMDTPGTWWRICKALIMWFSNIHKYIYWVLWNSPRNLLGYCF